MIVHFFFLGCSGGSRAAKMASSKTFFKPFCVNAEHSTYLTALNSRASLSPCSTDIGFCLVFASFSTIPASSRRSTCVPTNKNGVLGQWCVISGTHYKKDITWCVNPAFSKKVNVQTNIKKYQYSNCFL